MLNNHKMKQLNYEATRWNNVLDVIFLWWDECRSEKRWARETLQKTLAVFKDQIANGQETIIIGDLNTDHIRGNKHDNIVLTTIIDSGLVFLDTIQMQKCSSLYNSPIGKSWIEHVLVKSTSKENIQANILESDNNMSDHNALSIERDHESIEAPSSAEESQKLKPKWDNEVFKY